MTEPNPVYDVFVQKYTPGCDDEKMSGTEEAPCFPVGEFISYENFVLVVRVAADSSSGIDPVLWVSRNKSTTNLQFNGMYFLNMDVILVGLANDDAYATYRFLLKLGCCHPDELLYEENDMTNFIEIGNVNFLPGRYYWLAGAGGITIGECSLDKYSDDVRVHFTVIGDDVDYGRGFFTHAALVCTSLHPEISDELQSK